LDLRRKNIMADGQQRSNKEKKKPKQDKSKPLAGNSPFSNPPVTSTIDTLNYRYAKNVVSVGP
jgi:hypothetical protein